MTAATAEVLRALVDEEAGGVWGLQVVKRTGRPAGSVYPILERLESAGWVTSEWETETARRGPRRRLYELTADGRAAAREAVAAWSARSASPRKPLRSRAAAEVVA
ncbi:PadR family transcriptional regulator [Amnibacterium endophyticum]|uniref:PadR family transcriptional regulator n=1 Tax=Amnibacterium endophyticum TaxID=2109337 RepID=A0ABW4LEB4_9MICO